MEKEAKRIETMLREGKLSQKQADDLLNAMLKSKNSNPWKIRHLLLREWPTFGMVLLALLFLCFTLYDNTTPDTLLVPVAHTPTEGEMVYWESGKKLLLPLLQTTVYAKLGDSVIEVNVTQSFANPKRIAKSGAYTFPLPRKSVIDSLNIRLGSREFPAIINDPYPIQASDTIIVSLRYLQFVRDDSSQHCFSFPLTSSFEGDCRDGKNIALSFAVGNKSTLTSFNSRYHGVRLNTGPLEITVSLIQAAKLLNKDFFFEFQ